jgi:NADH-quinone oxidoreductase subunit J
MTGTLGVVLAAATTTGHASWVDVGTFSVAAAIILAGAVGVVVARNPVHSALMLVMTLFGVAVMFVLQRDPFLAAVQVIVYAGAIVVLFLFVIMFLGVDRQENIALEPLRGQRPLAIGLAVLGTTGLLLLGQVSKWTTGAPHVAGVDTGRQSNVYLLGKSVYTTYLFPFEATAALLVIAVVGAVVLARRPPTATNPVDGDDVTVDTDPGLGIDPATATTTATVPAMATDPVPDPDPVILAAGASGDPTDEAAPTPVTAEAVSSPEEARS